MRPNFHGGAYIREERGSALLEFAIALPLLVVFLVGIYDFSDAFNQKQKLVQAAHEGAIIAGAQPTSDVVPPLGQSNPDSLQPVVTAIVKSLVDANVIPQGSCSLPGSAAQNGVQWTYTFNAGCPLTIIINRGFVWGGGSNQPVVSVGTSVTVQYPYQWHFNSVIQLLVGGQYNLPLNLSETAAVQNQS